MVYAVDEHYYVSPEWLLTHTDFYDNYDRTIKVFAGEYACHIPGFAGKMNMPEANCMQGALAEAAFLTGIERNSDVVAMAAYAPLLARKGYTQWSPDLIWFDGKEVFETPSYNVQQMYSKYRGEYVLSCKVEEENCKNVFVSATEDADGRVILKLVNASDKDEAITFTGNAIEAKDLQKNEAYILSGEAGNEINSMLWEGNTFNLKKNSFCVLKL